MTQSWLGHPKGSGLNNFLVEPGHAYLVSVTAAGTFELCGTWAEPTFALKAGYNLISLPKSRESITTAEQLATSIPNCTVVWKWDCAAQAWVGHPKGGPNDFSLTIGHAYLVSVTADSNW